MGSAQLGAWLRLSSGLSSGLTWGLARGSGLGIRLGLSHGPSRVTWLGLVLGIGTGPGLGSAWKPGPARDSGLGSGLGAWLGSEPGSAHLGSENIINETNMSEESARQKRPAEKERRLKKIAHEKCQENYHDPPPLPQRNSASRQHPDVKYMQYRTYFPCDSDSVRVTAERF